MRPARTLARYVATEVLLYTTLAFLAATPVILLPNAFGELGDFAIVGVTAADLFSVLGWVSILVAAYAFPIAFVFGLLLALGRLYSDQEIYGMRACGVGTAALVAPVLAVGVLLSLLTAVVSIGLEHRAWREIEETQRRVLSRGGVIEPGRFARFGKRMILAQDRMGQRRFRNVMISDHTEEGQPLLIFAESAEYSFEPETGLVRLSLGRGDLRMEPYPSDDFEEHRLTFSTLEYAFPVPWLGGYGGPFSPKHLSLSELRHAASSESEHAITSLLTYDNPRYYNSQLHRMLAVPFTPFLFALIGVPLAILGFVHNRPRGVLLALLLLGGYYGLFIFGYDAGRDGLLPSWFAVWFPNVLVLVAAIILLRRTARVPR